VETRAQKNIEHDIPSITRNHKKINFSANTLQLVPPHKRKSSLPDNLALNKNNAVFDFTQDKQRTYMDGDRKRKLADKELKQDQPKGNKTQQSWKSKKQ